MISCLCQAIANYLKRDIVMVRIGSFKKNETLINAMCDPRANVTDRKKMFVFEEIDCYCKEEDNPFLIRGETSRGEVSKASYNISHLNRLDMSVGELLSKIEVQDDKLSLSGILNALDGPRETYDRVIIFTTNRIERIDPAILRPGRTDLIVYFGALLKEDVNRYFKLWFHKAIPMRVYSQMKDHTYTQAQIGKMFLKYSKNPEGLYELFGENRSE